MYLSSCTRKQTPLSLVHASVYQALVDRIIAYDFPMILNATEVPEGDELMFQRSLEKIDGTLEGDYIPDDFYEG